MSRNVQVPETSELELVLLFIASMWASKIADLFITASSEERIAYRIYFLDKIYHRLKEYASSDEKPRNPGGVPI